MQNGSDLSKSLAIELNEANARLDRIARAKAGTCSTYVGKVYNGGSIPTAADRYVLTNPVSSSGNEIEGAAAGLIVDTSRSVPVLVIGNVPVVGDILPADLIDGRWIAEKRGGGGNTPIGINIPNCFCQGTPATLSLTIPSYGTQGQTSASYANAYRNCTLAYYTVPPPYLPQSAFTGPGYYSTTSWIDDNGFEDYFRLFCFATQYSLGFGQRTGDIWQSPGQLYNWSVSKSNPGNTCNPFLLSQGQVQQGTFFTGQIIISG